LISGSSGEPASSVPLPSVVVWLAGRPPADAGTSGSRAGPDGASTGAAGAVFNQVGCPATTRTTASTRAASARLATPSASAKARPGTVVGTTDRPTSGLTTISRAGLAATAAASSVSGSRTASALQPASSGPAARDSTALTQPPRSSTSSVSPGWALLTSSARRPGSAPVSSVLQPSGRRAWCAAMRPVHSSSAGSMVAVAT
jgi:hypothetical protein